MSALERAARHSPTEIVFGENAVDDLGRVARATGARRALVVTDAGLVAAGHADRATRAILAADLEVTRFDDVHENPTTEDVDACLAVARAADIDLFIGLGGGSSIDTARGCNFLLTNGGRMRDYWGSGKATKAMLPMIAVPTTTGTGSEMQSYALIADAETHQKMACGDKKAAARAAVLDPTLATTQPRDVVACTGLDCVAHAVESAVTRTRNDVSQSFAREAWSRASRFFPRLLESPTDLEANAGMMLASAFAGIAIEHSMLGAAHALANPLTARFDVVHGHAVGLMLPHVVRFNSIDADARAEYARLARLADPTLDDDDDETAVASLPAQLERLLESTDLPTTLAACGIPADRLDALAEEAAAQWTGRFNPREVGSEELKGLYRAAL